VLVLVLEEEAVEVGEEAVVEVGLFVGHLLRSSDKQGSQAVCLTLIFLLEA
jgi:hypothetical protein